MNRPQDILFPKRVLSEKEIQLRRETKALYNEVKSIGTDTAKVWQQPYGWIPFVSLLGFVVFVGYIVIKSL